ncbi:MAG: thrombospondin type 3 repeat-containing protein [Dehalococcoidia bacterium]|nr:thrombospondin type 3 repeat-containing protein [Dehalococcoidia bacterium]
MPFRYAVPLAAVVLALAAGLANTPSPADASFHCIRIHEVMGGANGDASIGYVELKMIGPQNLLVGGGTQLRFFDDAGNLTGTYTFTTNAPSAVNSSILIGTSNFALNSTIPPDYTMPLGMNIPAPAGKVQFTGNSNCAATGTIIDSVAYGSYTGSSTQPPAMPAPVDCPPLPAAPLGPAPALTITGAQAIVLNNLNNTCSNNSTEYPLPLTDVSMGMAYGNNAGAVGHVCVPGPCPPPTATPTPTPTPGPGDADSDGVPDATDNCPNWPNPLPLQALPPWPVPPPPSDPDCDGFTTSVETFAGTLAQVQCPATTIAHDQNPDPWPVDNNDDRKAALADILAYIPVYGSMPPPPASSYNPRFDINADNKIGLADILKYIPFFNITCTP